MLFVGTKRQAQDVVSEEAQRCGMFYVNQRWLGGLLTNFATIQRSLGRLRDLEAMVTDGRYETLSKKEIARNEKEKRKLQKNLDGIRHMARLPDAIFIVDTKKEKIAVDEARKLKIPVIGIVDTNCDPDEVDFVIPGNDDALRAVRLFTSRIADAVLTAVACAKRRRPTTPPTAAMRMSARTAPAARRAHALARLRRQPFGRRCAPAGLVPAGARHVRALKLCALSILRRQSGVGTVPRLLQVGAQSPRFGSTGMATMTITAEQVKRLREKTGAGMMECKTALSEAEGDEEKAIELLRKKGLASAAKRAGRATSNGVVGSYIHIGGKVGVLVEVNCETDFVARTDDFQALVKELRCTSPPPIRVRPPRGRPCAVLEKEREIYRAQFADSGKPAKVVEKIVDGKLGIVLRADVPARSAQRPRPERHVAQMIAQASAKTGENITVSRFARFKVGEHGE